MTSNYNGLSDIARDAGLKTEWKCFEKGKFFNDFATLFEICKRIELLEKEKNND